jgi:hypothetical protein
VAAPPGAAAFPRALRAARAAAAHPGIHADRVAAAGARDEWRSIPGAAGRAPAGRLVIVRPGAHRASREARRTCAGDSDSDSENDSAGDSHRVSGIDNGSGSGSGIDSDIYSDSDSDGGSNSDDDDRAGGRAGRPRRAELDGRASGGPRERRGARRKSAAP